MAFFYLVPKLVPPGCAPSARAYKLQTSVLLSFNIPVHPGTPTSALAPSEDRLLHFLSFLLTLLPFRFTWLVPSFHSQFFFCRDVLQVIHCSYIAPCFDVLRQRSCCHCSCSWRQREPSTKRCSAPIPGQAMRQYKHHSKPR